jgi:hypothetical protein
VHVLLLGKTTQLSRGNYCYAHYTLHLLLTQTICFKGKKWRKKDPRTMNREKKRWDTLPTVCWFHSLFWWSLSAPAYATPSAIYYTCRPSTAAATPTSIAAAFAALAPAAATAAATTAVRVFTWIVRREVLYVAFDLKLQHSRVQGQQSVFVAWLFAFLLGAELHRPRASNSQCEWRWPPSNTAMLFLRTSRS